MNTMRELLQMVSRVFSIGYKVFIIFAVCVTIVSVFTYSLNRDKMQTPVDPLAESRAEFQKTLDDPRYKKDPQQKQILKLYTLGVCSMVGELCDAAGVKVANGYNASIFGRLSTAVAYPYANPPASGVAWIHDQLENVGVVPKTYAAEGIGFAGLRPLAGIWKIFRDISYTLIVLLIVILGFLIMFRFKINPQTVVTIENSLPRIFVTLLLITFSFAIGGLLIDLMYVVSSVVATVLGSYQIPTVITSTTTGTGSTMILQPYLSYQEQASLVTRGYGMQLLTHVFWKPQILELGYDLLSIAPVSINIALRGIISLGTMFLLNKVNVFNNIYTGDWAKGSFVGNWPGLIAAIVIAILLPIFLGYFAPTILGLIIMFTTGVFVFLTLLILLIKAYLRVIFNIIFSPLILLSGAIPGHNAFSNWIRGLAADLIVFPTVITVIMISGIIAKIPDQGGAVWQAPLIYNGLNPHAFKMIVSIGLLFWSKDIVAAMRKLFGVKPSGVPGFGVATVAGGLAGFGAGGGLQKLASYGSLANTAQYIPGLNRIVKPPNRGGGAAHQSSGAGSPKRWYGRYFEGTKSYGARQQAAKAASDPLGNKS